MSSGSKKTRESKTYFLEDSSLESQLQQIVNNVSKILEYLKIDFKVFKKLQQIFEQSNTLEEVIKTIKEMSQIAIKKITKTKKEAKIESSKFSNKENKENEQIGNENYENLEKVLQKYEAEIREHIRIEQQLKIYSDGLKESVQDLQFKLKSLQREMPEPIKKITESQKDILVLRSKTHGVKFQQTRKNLKSNEFQIIHENNNKRGSFFDISLIKSTKNPQIEFTSNRKLGKIMSKEGNMDCLLVCNELISMDNHGSKKWFKKKNGK